MKVLHVTTHMNIGGIANYILTLSAALKTRGVDVVVASSGGGLVPELERCGIPHRTVNIKTKFEFGPKAIISGFTLAGIVKKEKADVIHAHTRVSQVAALIASKMTGVPYVTTCHGYFKTRLRKIVDTWGRKVIAISDAVGAHLTGDLGVDAGRIELIYSGVDPDRFAKEYSPEDLGAVKRSLGLGPGPVMGTIGRLSPVKGQRFLVEAMKAVIADHPYAQAVIVGDGEEGAPLKSLARYSGIESRVHFITSTVDTHKMLSVMDIFVLPSVKEGLGIALLEALAAGRPCIASRVGGIADIIDDGVNGILVGVGDVKAIAGAISRLLSDPNLRKRMGGAGRHTVKERFSIGLMAEKTAGLYKRTV